MSGFLYYLPGPVEGVSIQDVRKAGLGYAFDSKGCACPGVLNNSPDGGQGVMAADPERVEKIGCYADQQVSRKIPGSNAYAVLYKDSKPGPDDLARKEQLGGHWVTLNDGNEWLIPVARGAVEDDGAIAWTFQVPQRSILNDNGDFERGDVVDQFVPLWDLATKWFDVRMNALLESDGDVIEFSFDGLLKSAVEALACNYVLDAVECDMIGILTEENAVAILDALIDMPTRTELLKKIANQHAGLPSDDGPSDATPDTDQP